MRGECAGLSVLLLVMPCPSSGLPWTRVETLPAADVTSVQRHGDRVFAGTYDTVYIGADGGTQWTGTTPVNPAASGIQSVVPAGGALWAGTYGQGVYRSVDAGDSWQPVNGGLQGLGATHIIEMVEESGRLYAGTDGAGVFVLDLATPTQWSSFANGYPLDTAGGVHALVLHNSALVAPAGGNGFVYRFPPGATAWQEVAIVPPISPGLLSYDLVNSAGDLFLGTSNLVYRSGDGGVTWTFAGNGLSHGSENFLATSGPNLFAAVNFQLNNHRLYRSADRGETWQQIDEIRGAYLYALEVGGDWLFAARTDGLWSTPLATVHVEGATWGKLKSQFRD